MCLKHVNVKVAHGSLQNIITWTKNPKRESKSGRSHVLKKGCSFKTQNPSEN
jgi:hypothetical protein